MTSQLHVYDQIHYHHPGIKHLILYLHQKGSRGVVDRKLVEIILAGAHELKLLVALDQADQQRQHKADSTSSHHGGKLDTETYLFSVQLYFFLAQLYFFTFSSEICNFLFVFFLYFLGDSD